MHTLNYSTIVIFFFSLLFKFIIYVTLLTLYIYIKYRNNNTKLYLNNFIKFINKYNYYI